MLEFNKFKKMILDSFNFIYDTLPYYLDSVTVEVLKPVTKDITVLSQNNNWNFTLTHLLTAIGIIFAGIFSCLLWKVNKQNKKINEQNLELYKSTFNNVRLTLTKILAINKEGENLNGFEVNKHFNLGFSFVITQTKTEPIIFDKIYFETKNGFTYNISYHLIKYYFTENEKKVIKRYDVYNKDVSLFMSDISIYSDDDKYENIVNGLYNKKVRLVIKSLNKTYKSNWKEATLI